MIHPARWKMTWAPPMANTNGMIYIILVHFQEGFQINIKKPLRHWLPWSLWSLKFDWPRAQVPICKPILASRHATIHFFVGLVAVIFGKLTQRCLSLKVNWGEKNKFINLRMYRAEEATISMDVCRRNYCGRSFLSMRHRLCSHMQSESFRNQFELNRWPFLLTFILT